MLKSAVVRIARLRRELAWVVAGQSLVFLGGFAGIKILTNAMGSEGYGRLALGMTIAGLFNMFVYGPIGQVVSRYFSVYRERGELNVYFFVLKKAHVVFGILLLACSGIAGTIVQWWVGADWALLVVTASLFGIVSGINTSFLSLQGAIRQRKIVALHQAADAWFRPVLAAFALLILSNSAPSAFVGFVTGTLLITLSQGMFALRNTQIRDHWHGPVSNGVSRKRASREFSTYASSIMIFAAFATISMYADRWILQGLFGENEVGIYAALYQLGNAPISFLFGLISQFMVPIIFERAGAMTNAVQDESSSRLLYQVVSASVILLLPIVIAAYYFSEPFVRILTNANFSKHSAVLWVMVAGISLFNIGQLLSIKGMNHNRPDVYLFPKAVQALSFVLLAYLLAKEFGLTGVAAAMCGSSFIYLCMVAVVNRRLEIINA